MLLHQLDARQAHLYAQAANGPDGVLNDGLCKIDGNSSSIQVGLLTFFRLFPTSMKNRTQILRKKTGESIPSFEANCAKNCAGATTSRWASFPISHRKSATP